MLLLALIRRLQFVSTRFYFAFAASMILLTTIDSNAASLYWKATSGGAGAWNSTDANWATSAAGTTGTVWASSNSADLAVFQYSPGLVTINSSGVNAGGLNFNVSGYALSGGKVSIADGGVITVAARCTASVSSTITSQISSISTTICKQGSGVLILDSANTALGTNVTFWIGNSNQTGASPSGGALRITNSQALGSATLGIGGNYNSAGNVDSRLELPGDVTFSNAVLVTPKRNIAASGYSATVPPDSTIPSTIVNYSGTNTLASVVSITSGGNYTIFDSGTDPFGVFKFTGKVISNYGVMRNLLLRGDSGGGTGYFLGTLGTGSGAGGVSLIKDGSGTWVLGSANTAANGSASVVYVYGGVLKVVNSQALSSFATRAVMGGSFTGSLALAGGVSIAESIDLHARSGTDATHLVNLTGNNSVAGKLQITDDGTYAVVQSDSGTLSLSNVVNNSTGTSVKELRLGGAGFGVVSGNIGTGTQTAVPLNMTKFGSGVWTLAGTMTTSGSFAVSQGTLKIGSAASLKTVSAIAVASGATLDLSAKSSGFTLGASGVGVSGTNYQSLQGTGGSVLGTVVLGSYGMIAPGSDGRKGTLTLQNLTVGNFSGGVFDFDLSDSISGDNDLLTLSGALKISNANLTTFKISADQGYLAQGSYTLVNYASEGGVSLANVAISGLCKSSRQSFSLARTTNSAPAASSYSVVLNVAGSPLNLIWSGKNGGVWNVASTTNWSNSTASDNYYYDLDYVTFDDTGLATTVVLGSSFLTPGSVTVNSNSKNYSITGSGVIAGFGGLLKRGTSKLIVANVGVNSYLGETVIQGGTLQLGDGVTLGAGSVGANSVVNDGLLIVNRPDEYTLSSSISGSGGITKIGSGALILNGDNSYDGETIVTVGALKVGSGSALGSDLGGTTVAEGASLDLFMNASNKSLGAEVVTFSGSGVNGLGAILSTGIVDAYSAAQRLEMVGDAVISAPAARYDLGRAEGAYFHGNGHTLTKIGTARIILVDLGYTGLGRLVVKQGDLTVQGSTVIGSTDALADVTVASDGVFSYWGSGMKVSNDIMLFGGTVGSLLPYAGTGTFSGSINLVGSGSLGVASGATTFFSGAIRGDADLYITSPGIAVVSGSAEWTGKTYIQAGTLQFGAGGTLNAPQTSEIVNNASLAYNLAGNFAVTTAISGSGNLIMQGSANYALGGFYTGLGTATLSDSASLTLDVNSASALATGAGLIVAGGTSSAKLVLDAADAVLVGTSNSGTLVLSGRSTATNAHVVNQSGYSLIQQSIQLAVGGVNYVLQSNAGTLAVVNVVNPNSSANRYLYLQGAGDGYVGGEIFDGLGSVTNVIKTGSGTWTLSGINSYTGTTSVNAGTLILSAFGGINGDVNVKSGATLVWRSSYSVGDVSSLRQVVGGSGTIVGALSFMAGSDAILAPGGLNAVGTLSYDSQTDSVSFENAVIAVDLAGANADLLKTTGSIGDGLSAAKLKISVLAKPTKSQYEIIGCEGSLDVEIADEAIVNDTRYVFSTVISKKGTSLLLNVSGTNAKLIWNPSSTAAVWDLKTTNSWINSVASTQDIFYDADEILFNDSSSVRNVALNATVAPALITFSGTGDYTLAGTGKISGNCSIVKSRTGTLTLGTVNDNYGDTIVQRGALKFSSIAAASAASSRIVVQNGGTLDLNPDVIAAFGDRVISIAGSGANGQGAIVATGSVDRYSLIHALELTADAVIGAATSRYDVGRSDGSYLNGNGHALTKTGTGRVILIDLGATNLGGVVISQGELNVQGNTVLGDSATKSYCNVSVASGGFFSYWRPTSAIANNVVLNGGAIGVQAEMWDAQNAVFSGNVSIVGSGTIHVYAGSDAQLTDEFSGKIASASGDTLCISGAGTAVLSGTQQLLGSTDVEQGTLVLGGTGSLNAVTVKSGASLVLSSGGLHTINSVAAKDSSVMIEGEAVVTIGCLVADKLVIGGGESGTKAALAVASTEAVPEPSTPIAIGALAAGFVVLKLVMTRTAKPSSECRKLIRF